MMDKGLDPSASEAGPSVGVPPMSKAGRLHRWADSLELRKRPTDDGASATRAYGSPLSVAFDDWALRAEGLRSDRLEDGIAFFDLSDDEMRSIVGCSASGRRAVAAERVRALADRADSAATPPVGVLVAGALVTGASVAAALGWMLAAS